MNELDRQIRAQEFYYSFQRSVSLSFPTASMDNTVPVLSLETMVASTEVKETAMWLTTGNSATQTSLLMEDLLFHQD